jgi:hypothetical protein
LRNFDEMIVPNEINATGTSQPILVKFGDDDAGGQFIGNASGLLACNKSDFSFC